MAVAGRGLLHHHRHHRRRRRRRRRAASASTPEVRVAIAVTVAVTITVAAHGRAGGCGCAGRLGGHRLLRFKRWLERQVIGIEVAAGVGHAQGRRARALVRGVSLAAEELHFLGDQFGGVARLPVLAFP